MPNGIGSRLYKDCSGRTKECLLDCVHHRGTRLILVAKENRTRTDTLVRVHDWMFEDGCLELSRYPCGQLNGSFTALCALRKTVNEPTRMSTQSTRRVNAMSRRLPWFSDARFVEARRRWVNAGPDQMKLANYFNRQFIDHISTFEANGQNDDEWTWTMSPESAESMGKMRVPTNEIMTVFSPKCLLCLNEAIERGLTATLISWNGDSWCDWRNAMAVDCSMAALPGMNCMRMMTARSRMRSMPGMAPLAARLAFQWQRLPSPRSPMP